MKKNRVIHLAHTVGNYGPTLSQWDKGRTILSKSFAFQPDLLSDKTDYVCFKKLSSIRQLLAFPFVLFFILIRFNTVHFNFGMNLLPYGFKTDRFIGRILNRILLKIDGFDLFVLKLFKKKILVIYQGSDSRLGGLLNNTIPISHAEAKQRKIQIFNKYADKILYLNPDLYTFLPKRSEFIPYFKVDYRKFNRREPIKKIRTIVHAPTNRMIKGTEKIIEVCNVLKKQGHDIELILIENLSRKEALNAYQIADLCIDQLYVGWYGGLAIEMLAMGIPVMSKIDHYSHIDDTFQKSIPIINVDKDSLKDQIERVLSYSPDQINEIVEKGIEFVMEYHDPEKITKKIQGFYKYV